MPLEELAAEPGNRNDLHKSVPRLDVRRIDLVRARALQVSQRIQLMLEQVAPLASRQLIEPVLGLLPLALEGDKSRQARGG